MAKKAKDTKTDDAPAPKEEKGMVEVEALVNIPGSMVGQAARVESGTKFEISHTDADRLRKIEYVK